MHLLQTGCGKVWIKFCYVLLKQIFITYWLCNNHQSLPIQDLLLSEPVLEDHLADGDVAGAVALDKDL